MRRPLILLIAVQLTSCSLANCWLLGLTASLEAEVPGFAYLEPKWHIPSITDLNGEEARTLGEVLAQVSRVLRLGTGAELVYLYIFGGGISHRPNDALNAQVIGGEVVAQMENGAVPYFSKDFPPLPEAELRAVAQRIQRRLALEE